MCARVCVCVCEPSAMKHNKSTIPKNNVICNSRHAAHKTFSSVCYAIFNWISVSINCTGPYAALDIRVYYILSERATKNCIHNFKKQTNIQTSTQHALI